MKIQIILSGRHYSTSTDFPRELDLPDGSTVADAVSALQAALSGDAALPASCLVAVGGQHVGTVAKHTAQPLNDGDELMIVAPVAGGLAGQFPSSVLRPLEKPTVKEIEDSRTS